MSTTSRRLRGRLALVAMLAVGAARANAQSVSIVRDETVVSTRARQALSLDPFGVFEPGVPVEQRMNVGVPVKLDLQVNGTSITDIRWSIGGGPVPIKDVTVASNFAIGKGFRTQCDAVPLRPSDLEQRSLRFMWMTTGRSTVSVTANVDGTPVQSSVTFDVRRNPKPEIFFVTGEPGTLPLGSDPGDNPDIRLRAHSYWHDHVQGVAPSGEFLRFHRGFGQKFNCWRQLFGYPPVKAYVPALNYVPGSPVSSVMDCKNRGLLDICHVGAPGDGTGVITAGRDDDAHGQILTLPPQYKLNNPGGSSLRDFADEQVLTDGGLLSWHDTMHGRICNSGDFLIAPNTPADPIFWRFHWLITKVHEHWQYLKLHQTTLQVAANGPFGRTVFFPEPEMQIPPSAAEGGTVNCFPPSGSLFAVGTTTVTCTVPDVTLLERESPAFGGDTIQVTFRVQVNPPDPAAGSKVDVFLVLDLSGSFTDDLPTFKAEAPVIMDRLKARFPDIRFGLATFQDYPIAPFGSAGSGDVAYERIIDLIPDLDAVKTVIAGLQTRFGDDEPQSQLAALFQAATGAGEDLSGIGFPQASIPANQQANFRPGAAKILMLWTDATFHRPGDRGNPPSVVPYPGPTFEQTVAAIEKLDPPQVISLLAPNPLVDPQQALADLRALGAATKSVAPAGGVDCNGDGTADIAAGQPLVCMHGFAGAGVGAAIEATTAGALQSPLADAGAFQVVQSTSPAGAALTLDGTGSLDPQGEALTFSWTGPFGTATGAAPTVTLSVGTHIVRLTVRDTAGNTGEDTVTIIVRPSPPVANAGPNQVIECGSPTGTLVTLDGSRSTDPDGDIVRHEWTSAGRSLGVGAVLTVSFGVGETPVTLAVTDATGLSRTDDVLITIRDTTAPVFTFVPSAMTITSCVTPNIGQARAQDQCGTVSVTNNAPSKFPLGKTVVTWSARDAAGHITTAKQTVTAILGDSASCCPAGTNVILGSSGSDVLVGTEGSDCVLLRGGDDVLDARGGNDFISGGSGRDTITAGYGDDYVNGGPDTDTCSVAPGKDTVLSCEVSN